MKTVERTALHEFKLDGQPVKPGQVVQLNRRQFNNLVAAGCIYQDADENDAVPKLSLAGEVGTAVAEEIDETRTDAGNAAHHNGGRLAGSADDAARVLADAADLERRRLESGVEADAQRAREEAARLEAQTKAKAEADAKAKAEAEAKAKLEADAKAKAEAEAKAKAEAEAKAKAEADAKAKAASAPGRPLTSAPATPPRT